MRRVVITGLGIVSSLGNNQSEVKDSLYHGKSGITFQPEYAERGLRSQVAGSVNINYDANVWDWDLVTTIFKCPESEALLKNLELAEYKNFVISSSTLVLLTQLHLL